MAIPAIKYTSPQEYLALERTSKEKHEYFAGKVLAMAGASLAHNDIAANLIGEIRSLLKDRPYRILPSDIRVSIPSRESYMYPDAVIVCGQPEMEDDTFDTLKNPVVIFEILSPSTEDIMTVEKNSFSTAKSPPFQNISWWILRGASWS
jgi:Uma2 family endonuclease